MLQALICGNRSIELLQSQLREFSFDSKALVTLRVDHLVKILSRFIEGGLSRDYVQEWAELLEVRDDVEFDPANEAGVKQAIHDLANPSLSGALDEQVANNMLGMLKGRGEEQF